MRVRPLAGLDVAVLAGGLGTRIQPVLGAVPKVLAPLDGRPFLDILLDWLEQAGAERVFLCLGHLADAVEIWLQQMPPRRTPILTAIEPTPLGTAGALARHRSLFTSDPILVINGDTFVDADLAGFVAAHRQKSPQASLLCAWVEDCSDYGTVRTDAEGLVMAFEEKQASLAKPGLVNAGLYLLSAAVLDRMAVDRPTSLEREVLPRLQQLLAVPQDVSFVDIGTPARLANAATVIRGKIAPKQRDEQ